MVRAVLNLTICPRLMVFHILCGATPSTFAVTSTFTIALAPIILTPFVFRGREGTRRERKRKGGREEGRERDRERRGGSAIAAPYV